MSGLLATIAACGDGLGPQGELTQFGLCSKPNWIAVGNGSTWQPIDVPEPQTAFGPVQVSAHVPSRVSVAVGFSASVQIYQLLREELAQLRCQQSSFPPGPFRPIQGSVAGVASGAVFQLAFGPYAAFRTGPGNFTANIRDTVATIMATQRPSGTLRSSGVLLIRDFTSTGQNAFPPLDFSSPDVRVLDSAQLTVTGTANPIFRSTTLRTGGTSISLESSTGSLVTHSYALTGSKHPSDLYAATVSSGNKSLTWYYADLANAAVALGPELSQIFVGNVFDSRCRRLSATIPVQPELSAGARIVFNIFVSHRSGSSVSVLVSRGFRGANGDWEVEIPDLGPDRPCAAPSTGNVTVAATAYGGNFGLVLGAPPQHGDQLRSVSFTRTVP